MRTDKHGATKRFLFATLSCERTCRPFRMHGRSENTVPKLHLDIKISGRILRLRSYLRTITTDRSDDFDLLGCITV
jgi:hypothetical protein